MKYLLDTHTLLWVLFEDDKLSTKAKEIKEYKKFGLTFLWN